MARAASRFKQGASKLEATLSSRMPRLLRAPAFTVAEISRAIASLADGLDEITEFSMPQEKREELAAVVESKGPPLLKSLVLFAREKVDQIQSEPGAPSYLKHFLEVERAHPYSTPFSLGYLLKSAEDSPSIFYNFIAQLEAPKFDECAEPEERSRPSLEWASRVVKNLYFPFGVRAVALIESIRTGRRLYGLDDGRALPQVNNSLKEVPGVPLLRSDFAILRNGESHPVTGFEVRADGSAILKDKNKGPVELSPGACAEIGTEARNETVRIVAALLIPALWRWAEDLATSNVVAIIAAEIRGEEAPELVSKMEVLGKPTEERLLCLGLLEEAFDA